MIAAQVTVPSVEISRMVNWCNRNIGQQAGSRDNVDLDRPWHWSMSFRDTTFYFCEQKYATMFALRWT